MIKSIVSSASLAFAFALSATAAAQGGAAGAGSCPPGSWFCAQDSQQQATPAGKPVKAPGLQPLPGPDDDSSGGVTYAPAPPGAPPVVVYQPPPPVVVVRPEPDAPPPYEEPPPPPRQNFLHRSEWGLNLHLEGLTIGRGTGNSDAGMAGGGFGLRLKPNRYFGIESDVDFVGGTDYQGDTRHETAVTFNALFFLNPKSRAQIYLLAGFGWSSAHVTSDVSCSGGVNCDSLDARYGYFGGQVGAGLEFRIGRSFALNADLRGFVRGRTDHLAETQPEFTSNDGRTTNTSGGGLITGGGTLYF
jgi:opacity protein-like surface antigen